jgi:carboxypeptidase D
MLFLSQPVGVGFSYQKIANGSLGPYTGTFLNDSKAAPATGTYPILDPIDQGEIDTTDLAAMAAWHIFQGFLSGVPKLAGKINVHKQFNLWTESYGGKALMDTVRSEAWLNYTQRPRSLWPRILRLLLQTKR